MNSGWRRWSVQEIGAQYYRNEFKGQGQNRGPKRSTIRKRKTIDMHTQEILEESDYTEQTVEDMTADEIKDFDRTGPRDIITYVWYEVPTYSEETEDAEEDSPYGDVGEKYGKTFRETKEEAESLRHLLFHRSTNRL